MSKPITEARAYRMREELRQLNKVVARKSRQLRILREQLNVARAERDAALDVLAQGADTYYTAQIGHLPVTLIPAKGTGPIRLTEADKSALATFTEF